MRLLVSAIAATTISGLIGCTSTTTSNTARTGVEQILVSNSVDQALDKVDFRPFAGSRIFIDDQYIDCVDKNYVVASVRHRVLRTGATIAPNPEESDVVLELRAGVVGTDTSDSFVGIPEITLPGMVTLPEVRLINRSYQTGTAKIGIVAYDTESKQVLGDGGLTMARSDDSNWYVMGVGPFQRGSVRTEVAESASKTGTRKSTPLPNEIVFASPRKNQEFGRESEEIQYTSGERRAWNSVPWDPTRQ